MALQIVLRRLFRGCAECHVLGNVFGGMLSCHKPADAIHPKDDMGTVMSDTTVYADPLHPELSARTASLTCPDLPEANTKST